MTLERLVSLNGRDQPLQRWPSPQKWATQSRLDPLSHETKVDIELLKNIFRNYGNVAVCFLVIDIEENIIVKPISDELTFGHEHLDH